jgi:hypothetical protein
MYQVFARPIILCAITVVIGISLRYFFNPITISVCCAEVIIVEAIFFYLVWVGAMPTCKNLILQVFLKFNGAFIIK